MKPRAQLLGFTQAVGIVTAFLSLARVGLPRLRAVLPSPCLLLFRSMHCFWSLCLPELSYKLSETVWYYLFVSEKLRQLTKFLVWINLHQGYFKINPTSILVKCWTWLNTFLMQKVTMWGRSVCRASSTRDHHKGHHTLKASSVRCCVYSRHSACLFVYYGSIKWEVKRRPIYEWRCDELRGSRPKCLFKGN